LRRRRLPGVFGPLPHTGRWKIPEGSHPAHTELLRFSFPFCLPLSFCLSLGAVSILCFRRIVLIQTEEFHILILQHALSLHVPPVPASVPSALPQGALRPLLLSGRAFLLFQPLFLHRLVRPFGPFRTHAFFRLRSLLRADVLFCMNTLLRPVIFF